MAFTSRKWETNDGWKLPGGQWDRHTEQLPEFPSTQASPDDFQNPIEAPIPTSVTTAILVGLGVGAALTAVPGVGVGAPVCPGSAYHRGGLL